MNVVLNEIRIRNASTDDCKQLADWWNDGKVMAHAGFPNGLGTTPEEIEHQLLNEDDYKGRTLIIEHNSIPIGEMNYHRVNENTAEIGIKICDFDCAAYVPQNDLLTDQRGSLYYAAPEIVEGYLMMVSKLMSGHLVL